METITALWNDGTLPVHDGLYLATGASYSVRVDNDSSRGIQVLKEFDLREVMELDPEWTTSIDITRRKVIPGGAGYLCCGEGAHGSEGFFARLNEDETLAWVVYLEEANPFADISIVSSEATFESTSGVAVTVDINNPEA